jgi:hypothetical protein
MGVVEVDIRLLKSASPVGAIGAATAAGGTVKSTRLDVRHLRPSPTGPAENADESLRITPGCGSESRVNALVRLTTRRLRPEGLLIYPADGAACGSDYHPCAGLHLGGIAEKDHRLAARGACARRYTARMAV